MKEKGEFPMFKESIFFAIKCLLFFITLGGVTKIYGADGSSGCGPGWYLIKDNSLLSSALRSTTNGVLFPAVTIGMTVGTSNCTKHSIVLNEKKSLHFLTMNFFEVKADVARGEGAHLSSFARTLGCSEHGIYPLSQALKETYSELYSNDAISPSVTLLEVYKSILRKPDLARMCPFHIG